MKDFFDTFGSFGVLSPTKPDAELAPFLGYFPPWMDGALVSLINSTKPGHWERESRSAGGLAEQRFMGLENLERYNIDKGHAYAAWIAHEAVARGIPFGLYLRNFLLGAEVVLGKDDPDGAERVLTTMTGAEVRMQKFLAEHSGANGMPFMSISNRAVGDSIPSLVLSNDNWERGAEILVQNAGVIIMYFLTLTSGVNRELDLLRAAGARERTLIVVADDPRKTTNTLFDLFRNREDEDAVAALTESREAAPLEPPSDFPHQVRLGTQPDAWDAVREAFKPLVEKAQPSPLRELPPLPPPDRPSGELIDRARDRARKDFDLATQFMEKGEGIAAEDALIRSIAFSHWARDPLGRAIAFGQLGNAERFLLKYPNEAVQSYLLAVDLFETLLPTSPIARQAFEVLVQQVAAYLKELGDPKRAEAVLARLGGEQSSSDRAGEARGNG